MRPSERRRVLDSVSKRWAQPVHGGGATLYKVLEKRLESSPIGLRTFVMFDSDRMHPDELLDGWTTVRPGKRPAGCQAYKWEQLTKRDLPKRYWMLQRRFIESYMPHIELEKVDVNLDITSAFCRMSQKQRKYFNMKDGFSQDKNRDDKERCGNLYSTLSVEDRDTLQRGFGPKLANHYVNAGLYEFNWDDDARIEADRALPNLMRLL